jgi:hypothetical protein
MLANRVSAWVATIRGDLQAKALQVFISQISSRLTGAGRVSMMHLVRLQVRRDRRARCWPYSFRHGRSIERMEIADHLLETGDIQMGVDLGSLDPRMPKQLLQDPQVGAA